MEIHLVILLNYEVNREKKIAIYVFSPQDLSSLLIYSQVALKHLFQMDMIDILLSYPMIARVGPSRRLMFCMSILAMTVCMLYSW